MGKKTKTFLIRVSEEDHFKILQASEKLTTSEYLRQCEKFYRAFDPDLIHQLEKAAELSKQDIPTVITQLLLTYMGQDFAINETMGKTKTWARAFQYDSTGRLITGNELSDKVTAEVKEAALGLKKRLEGMKEGKVKQTVVTRAEAGLMSAQL